MCVLPLLGQAIGGKAGGAISGLPFGLTGALLGMNMAKGSKPAAPMPGSITTSSAAPGLGG